MVWPSIRRTRSRWIGRRAASLAVAVVAVAALLGPVARGSAVVTGGSAAVGILGLIAAGGGGVDRLATAIRKVGDGKYDLDLDASGDGDLGRLAGAVESTAASVEERERAFRERIDRLQGERDRLSALFEDAPDPVARIGLEDETVRIREVNGRFEDVFECTDEEATGTSLFEHAGPDADSAIAAELQRSIARGESIEHDFEAGTTRGRRQLRWLFSPARATDGPAGYLTYTDLTGLEARDDRHALDEIAFDPELGVDEKLRQLLELGRERLGVEHAHVARIDRATNEHEVELAVGGTTESSTSPLEEAYCRQVVDLERAVAIDDASEEGGRNDPAHARWGFECYLGAPIRVGDQQYGALAVADSTPRAQPFTPTEKRFVERLARIAGHLIERRERQRELHLKDRAMEAAPVGITMMDPDLEDNPLTYVNETFQQLTGYDREEVVGRNCRFLQGEETSQETVDRLRSAVDAEAPITVELRNYRKDGTEFWNRLSIAPVEAEGEVTNFVGFQEDVTERRERQQDLERYREFIDDLLDAIDDVFYVLDRTGEHDRYNRTFREVTGYTDEEFEAMHPTEFFAEEDREAVQAAIQTAFETGHTRVQADLLTTSGERIPYEFVASRLETPDGTPVVTGIGRDVSEREEAMRQLETLVGNVPGMVYRCRNEPAWPMEFVSDGCRELTGYEPEALERGDVHWGEKIIDSDNGDAWEVVQSALERGEPYRLTFPIETADGQRTWVEEQGRGVYDEDGELAALEGVIIDVTERVEQGRELERTRDLLEQSQDLANVGAWEIDLRTDPPDVTWTDQVYRIHGISPDAEVDLEDAIEFFHPEDRDRVRSAFERAAEQGDAYDLEARLLTAEDDLRWIRSIGEPVRSGDDGIVGVRGSIQDVTERKERERTLRRLHETGRDLIEADSVEEVAERASQAAEDLLGLPINGVHFYDEGAGGLVPVAASDAARDVLGEPPTIDRGLAWRCFERGEIVMHDDVRTADDLYNPNTDIRSELHLPLGEHGVFIASSTEPEAFDETDVRLAKVLTATVESALDRTERERELQRYHEFTDDILDAADDMFYVVGPDFTLWRWNDAFAEATGYADDEIGEIDAMEFFAADHRERVAASVEEVFETGHSRLQADLLTSDGERIPYEFAASRVEDPDGETVLVGIGRDVSDRIERERRLEAIVANTTNPIYIKDREGYYRFVNQATADVFGLDPETVVGKYDRELFDEESAIDAREDDRHVMETGETIAKEVVRVVDGEQSHLIDNKYPYRDEDDEIVGVMGISRDVSELKERERELERQASLLDSLIEQIPIAIYVKDEEAKFVRTSVPYHHDRFPDDEEWFRGKTDLEAFPEGLAEGTYEDDRRVIEQGESIIEKEEYDPANDDWLLTSKAPWRDDDGEIRGLIGVTQDITDQKERQRELERQASLLDSLFEQIPINIYVKDEQARHLRTSTPHLRGSYPDDEEWFRGKTDLDIYDEELAEETYAADLEVIETGESIIEREEYDPADGEWLLTSKVPWRDDDGGIRGLIGVSQDITDQKERERELRETKRRLELALEGTNTGIWELDLETNDVVWNETEETLVGLGPGEFEGTYEAFERRVHPDDLDRVESELERAIENDELFWIEFRMRHEDGSWIWVSARGRIVEDRGSRRMIGINNDITDRKERERELREIKDRLEKYIEGPPVGVFALDPEGRVTMWNDAMERIFGWSAEEVVGEPYPAVPDDHAEEHGDLLERSLDGESFSQIELRRETKAGDVVDVSLSTAPIRDEDGEVVEIASFFLDITDRKERERELERTKNLLQQAQQVANVGGWEVDLTTDPPGVEWSDELYRIHDLPEDEEPRLEGTVELFHPEDRDRVREVTRALEEAGEPYDVEVRLDGDEDGDQRWVRAIGEPVYEDGEIVRLRGSVQDVTERKEHERTLETLHEVARELLGAESEDEIAELAIDAAREVLDAPAMAIHLLAPGTSGLEPVTFTGEFVDRCGTPEAIDSADELLWNVFATRTPTVFDDATSSGDGGPLGCDAESGLAIPIGDHGVLTLVAPSASSVDGRTRQIVETLVATTEAALDRLDSEASLREREAELEARNRRLEQQIGINEIIRSIDQALIRGDSRAEIESAVCQRLVESDDVAFAWIGSLDAGGDRLEPRAWAGANQEYLDAVSLERGSDEPAVRTAFEGEPTVVDAVVDGLKDEEWRKQALVNDFSSAISVPLAYDEYTYGVLAVYGPEPSPFGDVERSVFEELGENVASSINAVETQQALHADAVVELTLRFDEPEEFLARVARGAGCTIEYVGLATYGEDRAKLFFATDGDREAVAETLSELVSVEDYRPIGETDDGYLFEATVAEDVLAAKLVRHGASPRSIEATAAGMEVVVDVPTTTDVREFVGMIGDAYVDVELVSRQNVERDVATRQEHVGSLLEELTERQLDVLRTAYFAGFFEWPRESTGEEIAELLDVSQPTVNRHLRHGLARVLEGLFEGEAPPAAVGEGA